MTTAASAVNEGADCQPLMAARRCRANLATSPGAGAAGGRGPAFMVCRRVGESAASRSSLVDGGGDF